MFKNNNQNTLRFVLTFVAMLLVVFTMNAQGVIGSALDSVRTQVNVVQQVQMLVKVIAAIVAVIGAFTIFFKMQNGDQDVKKTILLVVGSCAALYALATTLPAIFGY